MAAFGNDCIDFIYSHEGRMVLRQDLDFFSFSFFFF